MSVYPTDRDTYLSILFSIGLLFGVIGAVVSIIAAFYLDDWRWLLGALMAAPVALVIRGLK